MSYYQYHEFQTTDRRLSEADKQRLRNVSSRAEITSTSFAVQYDYGDFKGNQKEFLARWFDLHLYVAAGGTRRLMIRLPARFARRATVERIINCCEFAEFIDNGEDCLLDIFLYDEGASYDGWTDGPGWLDALAPLRSDLLSGDLRLAYLLWLATADREMLEDDAREPLSGIGPLTEGLEAFGEFLGIDPDLVRAAADATAGPDCGEIPSETALAAIKKMPDDKKTELLHRFFEGDPLAHTDIRADVRPSDVNGITANGVRFRTLSELRTRAAAIREERLAARERAKADEQRRRRLELEEARRKRLDRLRRHGDGVWNEIETELSGRSGKSYDQALELVLDMHALAQESGNLAGFHDKLDGIRLAHGEKKAFIRRLDDNSAALRR
ncbi:MAG: hypothetical protein F4X97_00240 [Boseongicola sp. SB0662_bin_57]|nr:hypothetical protein [Boseongicola sp. SB0662_bin_57]